MRINLIFILCLFLQYAASTNSFAQTSDKDQITDQFTEQTSIVLTGVYNSSVVWGDYDNDGDLDILLTGNTGQSAVSKIYRNNGDNSFTEQTSIHLIGVSESSATWGDYDNDGDLDILLSGYNNNIERAARIYKNNGDNTFTVLPSFALTGVWGGSTVWGDCDNDGDLDVLLTGNSQEQGTVSKVYFNNGDDIFTEQTAISLIGVYYSSAAWGDYDGDGDLDILLSGHNGRTCTSRIYRNNGNSSFTEQSSIFLTQLSGSSAAWGDYDSDGDLDILLSGSTDIGTSVTKIYRNDGLNIFSEQTTIILTGVSYGSAIWGDYDSDGDLDILLSGYGTNVSKIYRNNGDNTFTEQSSILLTGVSSSSAVWGDYDNDGDLDCLLTGYSNGVGVAKLYRNNNLTSNTLPANPTNLDAIVNGQDVTLRWKKSMDNETPMNGLRYNLVIGSSSNAVDILSPMSDRNSGYRRLISLGNTNHDTTWTIKGLSPGTYYWSVQSIDNNFAGSSFAVEQSFTIPGVKLILEGFYNTETGKLNIKDTIKAYLRNTYSPYTVVDSATATIDSIRFTANITFINAPNGTYYLVIKHRNSIETWSKVGGIQFNASGLLGYNFTSAISQSFGNNMKQIGTRWCIYSGDVNQDGIIDISDLVLIDIDNLNFVIGYTDTDLNADGIVDITDLLIVDTNNLNFISKIIPVILFGGKDN